MKVKMKWIFNLTVAVALAVSPLLRPCRPAPRLRRTLPSRPHRRNPRVVGSDLGLAGKIGEAIKNAPVGKGKGQIDPGAPPGVFGIPGAPQVNYILAIFWAIWVGWIFSTVGAFGGIMAGVGHMSVYGLGDYARTFKDTVPALNKTLTDSIRTSNQWLVGLSAVLSVINYLKSKRMSWPLGLALGAGSIVGAFSAASLTGGKVSFSQYQGWFGFFVLVVAGFLFYETTPRGAGQQEGGQSSDPGFRTNREGKRGCLRFGRMRQGLGNHPVDFHLLRFGIQLQPHLGLFRWCRYCGNFRIHRRRWRISLCTLFNHFCRTSHVYRGRHFRPGRVHQYGHEHHHLYPTGWGGHGLGPRRHPAGGGFHRLHDWPTDAKVHSGHLAEAIVHRPGPVCRDRLLHQGVLRPGLGAHVKSVFRARTAADRGTGRIHHPHVEQVNGHAGIV